MYHAHLMREIVSVVTGAAGGIGYETALGLARHGSSVVLVGRNQERCQAAVDRIVGQTGNSRVSCLVADLFLQAENRRLATEIAARCPRVDVLVNNVGAVFMGRGVTADGVERTLALNHLGPYLLTRLLLPLLVASAPARIINVSSMAHAGVRLNFPGLDFSGWIGYQRSKLANLLFTYELARRLERTGVTVNALHPGLVASGFGMNNGAAFRLLKPLVNLFAIDNEAGARTSVFLATAAEVEGVTGKYYVKCQSRPSSAASADRDAAARLWDTSATMTGLTVD